MFAGRPGSRTAGRRRYHRARVRVQLADVQHRVDGGPRRHGFVVAGGQCVRVHVHVHAAPEPERRLPRRYLTAAVHFRFHLPRRRRRRRRQRRRRGLRRRRRVRRARHPDGNVLRRVHGFAVVGRPVQLPAARRTGATPVVHLTHVYFRLRSRRRLGRRRQKAEWRRRRTRSSVQTVRLKAPRRGRRETGTRPGSPLPPSGGCVLCDPPARQT